MEKILLRKETIEHILRKNLNTFFLEVHDESSQHHVPTGAQTHFKVIAGSQQFENLSRINRHRLVNDLLKEEFDKGLHALSLHLYGSLEELEQAQILHSPACRDGYKHKKE